MTGEGSVLKLAAPAGLDSYRKLAHHSSPLRTTRRDRTSGFQAMRLKLVVMRKENR